MTLTDYIEKRNGVPMSSSKSLRNNLYRSLGAKNFATFWNYWNPIFGYYLGKKIFKPLKNQFPSSIALLFTFIFCGLLHDFVTLLFRGHTAFFFSIWFLFMGISVLISKLLKHNFANQFWTVRALINLSFIGLCLILTIYVNRFLKVYF